MAQSSLNRRRPNTTATDVSVVYPSTSGNYRVRVLFPNGQLKHFYMKPNGEQHHPSGHQKKPVVLDDKEMIWCKNKWKETNKAVKLTRITEGDIFKKAIALAIKLDTAENKKAAFSIVKPVAKKDEETTQKPVIKVVPSNFGPATLGKAFGGLFEQLKSKLTS